MKVCPIAIVAGCEKCPFFKMCPVKVALGGYQEPQPTRETPAKATPAKATPAKATPAKATPAKATPAKAEPVARKPRASASKKT